MKKTIFTLAAGALLLSGCVIAINADDLDGHDNNRSSLTVRADDGTERTVHCASGQRAYAEGGDGIPLVLGCRDEDSVD